MNKISLQMYTLREHTKTIGELDRTLSKLSEIGFGTLQYSVPDSFDTKEVKRLFESYHLKNDSVFADYKTLKSESAKVLADSELFGTNYVRIGSMPVENTYSADGYREFAHFLNDAAGELKRNGKKLLYHFHAFEFERFGNECGIDIFLDETDPEVIDIIPDTHWIHSGGKDVVTFFEGHKERFCYIHVKDYRIGGRADLLEGHPVMFAPVGEGNLDWEAILSWCKTHGVLSYAIEQDSCYGRDEFECVKSSFDFLKGFGIDQDEN